MNYKMSPLWEKGEGINIKKRNLRDWVSFSKTPWSLWPWTIDFFIYVFETGWIFLFPWVEIQTTKTETNEQCHYFIFENFRCYVSFSYSSFEFWGYLPMWHFMTFFFILLYTVNNIFQDVAPMPLPWFTGS